MIALPNIFICYVQSEYQKLVSNKQLYWYLHGHLYNPALQY